MKKELKLFLIKDIENKNFPQPSFLKKNSKFIEDKLNKSKAWEFDFNERYNKIKQKMKGCRKQYNNLL